MGVPVAERRHQEAAVEVDLDGVGLLGRQATRIVTHGGDDAVVDQECVIRRFGGARPHGSVAKQRHRHGLAHYAG